MVKGFAPHSARHHFFQRSLFIGLGLTLLSAVIAHCPSFGPTRLHRFFQCMGAGYCGSCADSIREKIALCHSTAARREWMLPKEHMCYCRGCSRPSDVLARQRRADFVALFAAPSSMGFWRATPKCVPGKILLFGLNHAAPSDAG